LFCQPCYIQLSIKLREATADEQVLYEIPEKYLLLLLLIVLIYIALFITEFY